MPDPTETPAVAAPTAQPAGSTSPAAEPNKEAQSVREQNLLARAISAERERDSFKDAAKKAEDAKLAEQGNYQALAKSKEAEAGEWKSKYEKSQRVSALVSAGAKAGANDPNDLAAFVDLSAIDASDNSALRAAADKALADLKASKPYLFGKTDGKSGAPFPTPQASPGAAAPAIGGVTTADVHKMKPDELKAYLAEVSKQPLQYRR